MINDVCAEINNYFVECIKSGTFDIVDGMLELDDFLQSGQYFRIVGSVFNDGIYIYPASDLKDETFSGSIWAMSVPPSFIALVAKIDNWCSSDAAEESPYTSESFGGYAYTKATESNGTPISWQKMFSRQLDKYRRINVL